MESAVIGGMVGGLTVYLLVEAMAAMERWTRRRRGGGHAQYGTAGAAVVMEPASPKLDGESDDVVTEPDDFERKKKRPVDSRGFYA